MNRTRRDPLASTFRVVLMAAFALVLAVGTGQVAQAGPGPAPVNLGTAAPFAILSKSGISTVPYSAITGNLGVSPIDSTAITGFSLILDGTGTFSKSTQVTGKIFASDYTSPTPSKMTTAVGDMEIAYADAAGRTASPGNTNLYGGDLSGKTLAPGLYKWTTGVLINTKVTLSGPPDAVWIFQIAQDLTLGSGARVVLSGGARARNVFWQVGGGTGVEIGTTAHVEGTILAAAAIHLRTGASLNGRALAQTAVTLDQNAVVVPGSSGPTSKTMTLLSRPSQDGWVLESTESSGVGGDVEDGGDLFIGDSALAQQYMAILHFDTSDLPNRAVITAVILRIHKHDRVGSNPFGFNAGSDLLADIGNPRFGSVDALQAEDFESVAGGDAVGTFGPPNANDWYRSTLDASSWAFLNRDGSTQFRLRFSTDDDNDAVADYIRFQSGNALADLRPKMIIRYLLP